jgi:hydroxymethylpyrimidine/phosphomethylpyrimidine kinase
MDLQGESCARRLCLLLLGGLDPGGGAGVLRDVMASVELGASPTVVLTAITEQDSSRVVSVEPRDPIRVSQSLGLRLARLQRDEANIAVKIGMIATAEIALSVADSLHDFRGSVVFDPVLRASSGGALFEGSRDSVMALARRVTLLTPNLGEAAWLLGRPVDDLKDARAAAADLTALGIPAVLVKGGHLAGEASDVLVDGDGEQVFAGARVPGPSPRGTGCSLATAIAVGLAAGTDLRSSIREAKTWLTGKIAAATKVGDEWHL